MLKMLLLMLKLIAEQFNLLRELSNLCKDGTLRGDGRKVALVTKLFLEPHDGFFGLRELVVFDPIGDSQA